MTTSKSYGRTKANSKENLFCFVFVNLKEKFILCYLTYVYVANENQALIVFHTYVYLYLHVLLMFLVFQN